MMLFTDNKKSIFTTKNKKLFSNVLEGKIILIKLGRNIILTRDYGNNMNLESLSEIANTFMVDEEHISIVEEETTLK